MRRYSLNYQTRVDRARLEYARVNKNGFPAVKTGPSGIAKANRDTVVGETAFGMVTAAANNSRDPDASVMIETDTMHRTEGVLTLTHAGKSVVVAGRHEGGYEVDALHQSVSDALGDLGLPKKLSARFGEFMTAATGDILARFDTLGRQGQDGIEGEITTKHGHVIPVRLADRLWSRESMGGLKIQPTGPARKITSGTAPA